jgi:hypothetical protein
MPALGLKKRVLVFQSGAVIEISGVSEYAIVLKG